MESLKENIKEFIKENQLKLKSQKRFRHETQHVFTEEVNKIALSANRDKKKQSINSVETIHMEQEKVYYVTKEKTKYNNMMKQYKDYF